MSSYPTNSNSVIDLGTVGTCTNTLAYDNVSGDNSLRYVGSNPCNYVTFNGEKWRIIGVFEDGTHGKTGEKLVKIIRDESLNSWLFDYKRNGVGSSSGSGSNDWSDSEVMMLMNPTDYINTGIKADGTSAHTYTIVPDGTGNYIKDSKNMYRNMGSYYDGLTVYNPAQVGNNGWNSNSTSTINTLQSPSKDMIEEVNWHIRGSNASYVSPFGYLAIERSTGSAYNSSRAVAWTGKIGLIYTSDYGLATAGGSNISRNDCLNNTNIRAWSTSADCVNNNWIRGVANDNATSDSDRSNSVQFTITPFTSQSTYINIIGQNGTVNYQGVSSTAAVRPTLYLKSEIVVTGGDGTWSNPYTIDIPTKYTVTYSDGVNETAFVNQVYSNLLANTQTPSFVGTPTRSGYTFLGWSPSVASTVTTDVTYVAQWQIDQSVIQYADLEINKTVTGNMADIDELFDLEINLTQNGNGVNASYDYYIGTTLQNTQITFTNGVAHVNISSVNNITIKDLEVGTDFTIIETTNGYTATNDTITGTINNTSNVITFVNNKEQSPATGREVDLKFAYSFIVVGPAAIFVFKKSKMK